VSDSSDNLSLDGRVALVTGGGRGLGRAFAYTLAALGAQVAVNNRSTDRATAVVEELSRRGGRAVACPGDLESPGVAQGVVDAAIEAFGRLDILVNNAGGFELPQTSFAGTDPQQRDAIMRQNFTTAWDVTAAAWPHLVSAGYGRIVLFGSPIAIYGAPGFAHYAAAKGAVIGLARTLALEGAAHGITVNVINPLANTRMTPGEDDWSRWYESSFTVDHVAAVLAWLVDERFTATGQIFSVGGSRVARVYISETSGYVDEAPLTSAAAVAEHFDAVVDDGRPVEFSSLGEFLGYMGELYGAPKRS
jgi:NAD(P)-dependent dehydrogenase (short-subunit alcohol dehydrogenase family)